MGPRCVPPCVAKNEAVELRGTKQEDRGLPKDWIRTNQVMGHGAFDSRTNLFFHKVIGLELSVSVHMGVSENGVYPQL